MKAKGIQTDLRVRDDVCGPGPTYMVLALLIQRTLPTAEEPWRGEERCVVDQSVEVARTMR